MGSIVSDGLYIVFQWIEERRRREIERLRQYNENTLKSIGLVTRRIRMMRGETYNGVPNNIRLMLFGVPGTTRSGRWFQRPDHAQALDLYHHWIRRISAYSYWTGLTRVYKPRYLPGL